MFHAEKSALPEVDHRRSFAGGDRSCIVQGVEGLLF